MFEEFGARLGYLDALINNAGIAGDEKPDLCIDLNLVRKLLKGGPRRLSQIFFQSQS